MPKPKQSVITESFLLQGQSVRGGWTKPQLALLGVAWPPVKGWKKRVIGQPITEANSAKFLRLLKP